MFRSILRWLAGLLVLLALPGWAADEPLDAEQAFQLSTRLLNEQTLEVSFKIADGYYLYRQKFKFASAEGVALGQPDFPPGQIKKDDYFGEVETYRQSLTFTIPVTAGKPPYKLTVTAQGCADFGLCYPPLTQTVEVGGQAPAAAPADETGRIGALLQGSNVALILASFFGFGLLLAFTPCVFPMIPILSGIIIGQGDKISKVRALTLSVAYVLGMALTYTLAGVAAGLSGTLLSSALQNVWVLGGFGLVFVLLSLSMFGFYELQLPASLQSKLNDSANAQQGGSLIGVSLMGALSALIVGPCVAAPLAGALLYIAQTKNAALGGSALFFMALGMGAPLLLVGVAARTALPRAGAWMNGVKKAFGVILLGVAVWLISPVVPSWAVMLAWSALALLSGVFLRALDPLPPDATGGLRFWKGIGVLLVLLGSALFIGTLAGSRDPLQPLASLHAPVGTAQAEAGPTHSFERVTSVAQLEARLQQTDRPVMVDFYADWCVSCKEMERFTFSDPTVRDRMAKLTLVQVDVTHNTDEDKALLKRFKLFGPPGIVFFDHKGQENHAARVVGFKTAAQFAPVLDSLFH